MRRPDYWAPGSIKTRNHGRGVKLIENKIRRARINLAAIRRTNKALARQLELGV